MTKPLLVLQQGLEHENASVAWIREYCHFAGLDLHADPRFPTLLKEIGVEA